MPFSVTVPVRAVKVPELDQLPPTVILQELPPHPAAVTSKVPAVRVKFPLTVSVAPS